MLAAFMLANALYLLLNRWVDMAGWNISRLGENALSRFFQVLVLAHTGVGLLLAVLLVVFLLMHLPVVWKRHHRSSVVSGLLFSSVGTVLVVTGLFILTEAASRDNKWAWWIHVACAVFLPLAYGVHRVLSYSKPAARTQKRFATLAAMTLAVLLVFHGVSNAAGGGIQTVADVPLLLPATADTGFIPVGSVSPHSPFFPSATTTASGQHAHTRVFTRDDTVSSAARDGEIAQYGQVRESLIGAGQCDRCHQDIVSQWAGSAHRFASFNNPFYEATVMDLRENSTESNDWIETHVQSFPEFAGRTGPIKSRFCAGCHDPALLLTGMMAADIDRASVEAQAGLTCMACHAIDSIHDRTGNGNYNIADQQEDPYIFSNAADGSLQAFLHDAALKAKPNVHKRMLLKPFFRQSEFCATCHKVSLTEPVNDYRWLRGQDEFDNWDDSGVSLNASRTFYLPAVGRVCQDCHMPLEPARLGDVAAEDGMVKSHRFTAANTALPFVRGDQDMLSRIEAFLQDEKVSVDIFALRRGESASVLAIDRSQPTVVRGDRVTVDVVVRNRGVGHTFPGGTNDSNEGWLEFLVKDSEGTVLAVSGALDSERRLDPMAHVYKAVMLDKQGRRIERRNGQDIYVTVFANVIGPGTADLAHFEFEVPQWLSGSSLTFEVRLLWRKFDRGYTEFAFNANPVGFKQFSQPPELPITQIAADTVVVALGSVGSGIRVHDGSDDSEQWIRYNDYGIGSLLEGNTRAAARAFTEVSRLRPDRIDGPLNLAKTAIQDGNIEDGYRHLQDSEAIEPGNSQAAWVWGVVSQEDGRYDEALLAYTRVLEEFPRDRAAWRNMGRSYYLNGQFDDALSAFATVLEIDPEDRISHYHRMLSLRALGRKEEAERSAAAYEYYSIDESAQEVTRTYRLGNPGANLMAQPIRTHILVLRQPGTRRNEGSGG